MPLPETPLAEGPGYPVPNVVLYDEYSERTRSIIEVCTNRSINSDLRKVIRLTEGDDFSIQEGFIFNYKTNEWFRYRKGDGGSTTISSLSELMSIDSGPMLVA